MPPATRLQDFIAALSTGKTKAVTAMDALFGTPEERADLQRRLTPAQFGELTNGFPSNLLPAWAKTELALVVPTIGVGDFQHMDDWPDRVLVRQKIADAFGGNGLLEFFWGVYSGTGERTVIETDPQGNVSITFKSPRNKVNTTPAGDEVTVTI